MAAYEVNISCPNVDAGGMTMGCHVPSVEKVVSLCRAATKRPLIVKLTPNVTDITEIAKAAEAAGADGISLINTLLGMAVDARTRRPKLARVVGGYSGPAVKPVALRMVWQVAQAVSCLLYTSFLDDVSNAPFFRDPLVSAAQAINPLRILDEFETAWLASGECLTKRARLFEFSRYVILPHEP